MREGGVWSVGNRWKQGWWWWGGVVLVVESGGGVVGR